MLSVATIGAMLTNHAWREAQEEEVEAALRAAVAATSHFMRGSLAANEDNIKERVAGVMRGLLEDLVISKDDIVLEHDAATGQTTIRVGGDALYAFKSLWAGGQPIDAEPLRTDVTVAFDQSQYEFALSLDVSPSMGNRPDGWSKTKLKALQDAVSAIAQTVDDLSTTNPGIVALSLVPYSNVVNVADTSGAAKTDAKERYVRMLTGADYSTQISRDATGHWVDTFHSYGTGADMGPLASRDLPDFLVPTDWNLHQSGTENISMQRPDAPTWRFRGQDFWNGCVMARWGAYWDSSARPVNWDPDDAGNWPAATSVDGWAPGSTGFRNVPLHLSDAPPDAADTNTRFTAYSWPDAGIHGTADGYLHQVMRRTLTPGYDPWLRNYLERSDNHWVVHLHDRGGGLLCPEASIVPLTDDLAALRAVNNYKTVQVHSKTNRGQTFLHLGMVWGLRTLSPLWRDVWDTRNGSGAALPRTPCAPGGTTAGCSPFVEKAIVIISDGDNVYGPTFLGRSFGTYERGRPVAANPSFDRGACHTRFFGRPIPDDAIAMSAETPATFASSFDVDSNGNFTAAGLSAVLDGFQAFHPATAGLDPTVPPEQLIIDVYRGRWENALRDMTPWQLFRGHDRDSPTAATDATDVLTTASNWFNFEGRPVRNRHFCRPHTVFSAYGRADELVRIGDGPPVDDVAPFSLPSATGLDQATGRRYQHEMVGRLDNWFRQACGLAGRRGVRIHAIYIGTGTDSHEMAAISLLEECVDRGHGGASGVDEVHVAPTAQALEDAIGDIIDIRRTLRFLDP